MLSVLVCFLCQLGVVLYFFCRSLLCYVCVRCVKYFTEIKEEKTVFNFFVFCLLQKLFLPILTISLHLNSIRLILFNAFMKEEGP